MVSVTTITVKTYPPAWAKRSERLYDLYLLGALFKAALCVLRRRYLLRPPNARKSV